MRLQAPGPDCISIRSPGFRSLSSTVPSGVKNLWSSVAVTSNPCSVSSVKTGQSFLVLNTGTAFLRLTPVSVLTATAVPPPVCAGRRPGTLLSVATAISVLSVKSSSKVKSPRSVARRTDPAKHGFVLSTSPCAGVGLELVSFIWSMKIMPGSPVARRNPPAC